MSELTKEYFDQVVKSLATVDSLKNLASKEDLAAGLAATEKRIIKRIDDAQKELAVMVANGFEDIQTRLDVTAKIQIFEHKFKKLEEALHIKL